MVDLPNQQEAPPLSEDEKRADKKAAKKRKKLEKSLETRVLDPWERYRALTDLLDRYMECAELQDRKTRFGLIILGTLNAVNVLVLMRPEVFQSGIDRSWLWTYAGSYLVLSLYVFIEAVDELKPRLQSLLQRAHGMESSGTESAGLCFMRDVAAQSVDEYNERWRQARFDQLNRELVQQSQQMSLVNLAKFAALNRLYKGLLVLIFLTAGLFAMIAYQALRG